MEAGFPEEVSLKRRTIGNVGEVGVVVVVGESILCRTNESICGHTKGMGKW